MEAYVQVHGENLQEGGASKKAETEFHQDLDNLVHKTFGASPEEKKKEKVKKEEVDIFDVVLEFLCVEGYAETLEEAEWMMANVLDEEAIAIILDEANHPIYSRGGEQRRTQTALQVLGRHATARDKKTKHNIPKGGTTISDRDPEGKRLFTGDQDRGKGSKAARRAAALNKEDFEFWVDALVEEGYDLSDYSMEEMFEIYLDEAEGSYGQTPKARAAMGRLAIARREKPASEYSQKGEKTKKVRAIEKHTRRIDNGPDAGDRGKKSTKPRWSGYAGKSGRGKLDQDSRDYARDSAVEYTSGGHKPGSGTVTKNPKKLRKQRAMGEIAKEEYGNFEDWYMINVLGEEMTPEQRKARAARLDYKDEVRAARRAWIKKANKGRPEYEGVKEAYQDPKFSRKDYLAKLQKRGGMGMGTKEDPHGYRDPKMAKVGAEFSKRVTAAHKSRKSGEPDAYRAEKEGQSKKK
jgi:hypothetical protein